MPAPAAGDFCDFNPRSPRGERPGPVRLKSGQAKFQSTLPAGGATKDLLPDMDWLAISIHAPRGGSD